MEIWKPIAGYEEIYEVSDLGRVRRIKAARNSQVGRIIKPRLSYNGYYQLALNKNGAEATKRICRLVAQAFVENPHNKPQVNHKNAIKTDDRPANLEWVSELENAQHATANGLYPLGIKNGRAKLREEDIMAIRQSYDLVPTRELVRKYGVHRNMIYNIVKRKNWTHI